MRGVPGVYPFWPQSTREPNMVKTAFVAQSFIDVHCKLQKLKGFAGVTVPQLLEVSNKAFVNRDQEAQKVADKWMRQEEFLLAAASGNLDPVQQTATPTRKRETRNRPLLHRYQCANCKETGHWRNKFPHRREVPERPNNSINLIKKNTSFKNGPRGSCLRGRLMSMA